MLKDNCSRNRISGAGVQNDLQRSDRNRSRHNNNHTNLELLAIGVVCLEHDLVTILPGLKPLIEIGGDLKSVFIGKFIPTNLEFTTFRLGIENLERLVFE